MTQLAKSPSAASFSRLTLVRCSRWSPGSVLQVGRIYDRVEEKLAFLLY